MNKNQIVNTKALNNYIKELYDLWLIDGNEISDTFHTFGELYDYRMMYNALLVNELAESGKYEVFKTKRHNDGKECFGGGWFLVSIYLPIGVIDNHYENKYWDLFHCPEVDKEPFPYDGHTSADVLSVGRDFARRYEYHHLTPAERDIIKSELDKIDKKKVISIEKIGSGNLINLVIWVELNKPNENGDTEEIFIIENFNRGRANRKVLKGLLFNKKYTPEELNLDV